MQYIDIIVDLFLGDTGKGKCINHYVNEGEYTHVLKCNGSSNSGRTVYVGDKKIIIHSLPDIPRDGIKLIIGPGCYLNKDQFLKELNEVKEILGIENPQIFISKETQVITKEHIIKDSKDIKIGTTRQGNGPAARDRYDRIGIQAKDVVELQPYLIDIYEEFFINFPNARVLGLVVQGFYLDIIHGDYPYVTSSHTSVAGCLLNGIPHTKVRDVIGIAKTYSTYVGAKDFGNNDPIFDQIRDIGNEYGATTGRPRKIDWLYLDDIKKAININGANIIIFNKADILKDVGVFKLFSNNKLIKFSDELSFNNYILKELIELGLNRENIIFSYSPEKI